MLAITQCVTLHNLLLLLLQIEQKIDDMFTTRLRISDITKPMINQIVTPSAQNLQKLEVARRAAAQVNLRRNLGDQAQDVTQKAAFAIFNSGVAAPQVSVSSPKIEPP